MKLSANARAFVAAEVKSAFAEEYRKAEEAESAAAAKAAAKWKAFKKDLDVVAEEARKKAMAVIRKHGLTPASKDEREIFEVKFKMSDTYYSDIHANTFKETADDNYNPEICEARRVAGEVESRIKKAASKALFEIEVHGKRDTLESIVAEVVKSIKEGK